MIKRTKQPRLVITFHTTSAALQMEQCAKQNHFSGRLIPVPREISAGCGLAWRDTPENERVLYDMMTQERIEYDKMRILVL